MTEQKEETSTRWIVLVSIAFIILAAAIIVAMAWASGATFTTEWCRFEDTC